MQDIIIRAVGYTLLHSLWQGLLLAAGAGVLMILTKQAAAALRYKLLCSLLIIFAAIVAYTFYRQLAAPTNTVVSINSSVPVYEQLNGANQTTGAKFLLADRIRQIAGDCTAYFNQYSWLLVLIWFFIFLFHFVKLLLAMANAERMRYYKTSTVPEEWNHRLEELCQRLQIQKPILLMESALLKVPVLVGYVKPVILIPVGMLVQLPAEQVEAILLHELAHVSRHDYLVNLVQNAVDTLFFFNPAIRWISSLIRNERENCCDDMAIQETRSRKQFVEALVSFNQYSNTLSTCSLSWATGKGQLLQRVQRIVNKRNHSLRSGEMLVLLAVLLLTGSAFMAISHSHQFVQPVKQATAAAGRHGVHKLHQLHDAPEIIAAPAPVQAVFSSHIAKPILVKKPVKINTTAVEPVRPVADKTPVAEPAVPEPPCNELTLLQKQLYALGYTVNNTDKLQVYRDHGVSPAYIKSLLNAGFSNISLDQFLRLKDHGVQASFIFALKNKGYGTVGPEKALTLVDHGVTLPFIESFRQLGFNTISLEEATTLMDHGVTASFIESFKKKTGQLLSLDDYIRLRDSGISPV